MRQLLKRRATEAAQKRAENHVGGGVGCRKNFNVGSVVVVNDCRQQRAVNTIMAVSH